MAAGENEVTGAKNFKRGKEKGGQLHQKRD